MRRGAILLLRAKTRRALRVGQRVEVVGVRSTKAGMAALRLSRAARVLGTGDESEPRPLRTGDAGEPAEAQLVVARGALGASARRAPSGTVWFEIDDGSGPLRVVAGPKLKVDRAALTAGAWVEVRGVLGRHETAGSQPRAANRIWPRSASEIRSVPAPASADVASASSTRSAAGSHASVASAALASLDVVAATAPAAGLVAATTGLLGIVLLVLDGHAAALPGIAPLTAQVVHVVAAAIWVGGIVGILALVRWPGWSLRTGSASAAYAGPEVLGAPHRVDRPVGLTGVYSAWSQTGALVTVETEYGRTLLMKTGFAVGLAGARRLATSTTRG